MLAISVTVTLTTSEPGAACPLQQYLQKHWGWKMHLATWKRGEKLTLSNSMTVHALFSNWPTFWQLQPIFSMTLRGHNPWIPKLSNPWQNTDNPRGKPELSLDILHSEAVDHVLMQAAAAVKGRKHADKCSIILKALHACHFVFAFGEWVNKSDIYANISWSFFRLQWSMNSKRV